MGLFGKKEKDESRGGSIPTLPDLPTLPSFSDMEEPKGELPPLPSFPKNLIGEKFSQDTIKKAVNGEKEERRKISEDDFAGNRQMIQESPQKEIQSGRFGKYARRETVDEFEETERRMPTYEPQKKLTKKEIPEGFEEAGRRISEIEPVFVRIDKFEESRRIFEKTKEQISNIERALSKIKAIKQEEDRELSSWEQEITNIKDKISKVERDIFSKT
ncbi:MAG: hypothetical protein ABIH28_01610 [archaeon]